MIKRASLWAGKAALVVAAVMLVAFGLAWWRLSAGPLALPALEHQFEAELSRMRDGRPVDIASVELSWSGEPRALQLHARDVRIFDGQGKVISRYRNAEIGLGVLPLLIGRIAVVRADFDGGDISITKKRDGTTEIAFGPIGSSPDIVIPGGDSAEPLSQKVNRLLDGLARAFRPVGAGGSLRSVSLRGAHIEMVDEGNGARWTAERAIVALTRSSRALALAVDARVEGPEGGAPVALRVTTDTGFRAAQIQLTTRDARPRALFSPAMLGVFASVDAPITAAIDVGLDRRIGVNKFEGDIVVGRGGAEMNGERFSLDGGRIHGRYDLAQDVLTVDEVALTGSRTHIRGEARLANASALFKADPNAPAEFDLVMPTLALDVPGVFEQPFDLSRVRVSGALDRGVVRLTRVEATRGQAHIAATGLVRFMPLGAERRLYPGISLDATISGETDPRTVLVMWPIGFIQSARDYLKDALLGGTISNASVKINASPQEIAAHQLNDPSLDIRFSYSNASVRFIDTMSPLMAARGDARLTGNAFHLNVADGRLEGLATTGAVDFPRLNPKGEMMSVNVRAEGEARSVIALLMQEPISIGPRLPIEPTSITGRGAATFNLQRPNLSETPFEALRFTVDGSFENVGGVMKDSGLRLANGSLRVRGDQRAITISGPAELGSSTVNVSWTERLGANIANSSRYQISGLFDANDLEALGYPAPAVSQGRIGVTVTGEGAGFHVSTAQIALDLTRARVFFPSNFWTKESGIPANVTFDVAAAEEGDYLLSNIVARGAGLSAQGDVRLFADGRVRQMDISRFTAEGRADLAITGRRAADGVLEVSARGALLDAAPFLDAASAPQTPPAIAQRPGQPAPTPRPIRINVTADRIEMRGGAVLANGTANLVLSPTFALQTLVAEGRSPGGGALQLALGPRASDPQGRIAFRADDAGFAWKAFTGADNIVGGSATADGTWRMGPPSIAQFNLHMRDFRVVRVPAMAHLLGSVASLTGFVEMLNGEGISFSSLDAPVTMNADTVAFEQARMAGPTLGLTANGNYNMGHDDLDVDGVVVPSYGLNSVLGNVPILGNLLTSRRGEGVIGMTYAVNGPVAAPRVGVNPLSALTPGILRRIFEPIAPRRREAPTARSGGG